jgi:hypothetical protein
LPLTRCCVRSVALRFDRVLHYGSRLFVVTLPLRYVVSVALFVRCCRFALRCPGFMIPFAFVCHHGLVWIVLLRLFVVVAVTFYVCYVWRSCCCSLLSICSTFDFTFVVRCTFDYVLGSVAIFRCSLITVGFVVLCVVRCRWVYVLRLRLLR